MPRIRNIEEIIASKASGDQTRRRLFTGTSGELVPYVMDRVDLSVVIPVYGSAKTLPELHRRLTEALPEITANYEIVFVFDCSPDNTWDVLQDIFHADHRVRVIRLMKNFGQQRAVLCGFAESRGDLVVTMDDDLQHRPEDIQRLHQEDGQHRR